MRASLIAMLAVAVAVAVATAAGGQAPAPRPLGGTLDLGYVSSTGNSRVETFSFGDKLTWKAHPRFVVRQSLRIIYGEANSKVNSNLLDLDASADYTLFNGFGITAGAGFDRNRFAGLARRTEQSLGVSWRFTTLNNDSVRVTAASSWTQQRNVQGVRREFIAIRSGIWYKHVFKPGTFLQQAVEAVPNLDTREDWRLNSETSLVAPLSRKLGLKVAYVVRYDNLPEPKFQTTDRILTTGLQITY